MIQRWREFLADLLTRLARWLLRCAEALRGRSVVKELPPQPELPVTMPGGVPEHWLKLVRRQGPPAHWLAYVQSQAPQGVEFRTFRVGGEENSPPRHRGHREEGEEKKNPQFGQLVEETGGKKGVWFRALSEVRETIHERSPGVETPGYLKTLFQGLRGPAWGEEDSPQIEDIENRRGGRREEKNLQFVYSAGEVGEKEGAGFRALSEVRENLNKKPLFFVPVRTGEKEDSPSRCEGEEDSPQVEDIEKRPREHREEGEENNSQSVQMVGETGGKKGVRFRALSEVRETIHERFPGVATPGYLKTPFQGLRGPAGGEEDSPPIEDIENRHRGRGEEGGEKSSQSVQLVGEAGGEKGVHERFPGVETPGYLKTPFQGLRGPAGGEAGSPLRRGGEENSPQIEDIENRPREHREEGEEKNPQFGQLVGETGGKKGVHERFPGVETPGYLKTPFQGLRGPAGGEEDSPLRRGGEENSPQIEDIENRPREHREEGEEKNPQFVQPVGETRGKKGVHERFPGVETPGYLKTPFQGLRGPAGEEDSLLIEDIENRRGGEENSPLRRGGRGEEGGEKSSQFVQLVEETGGKKGVHERSPGVETPGYLKTPFQGLRGPAGEENSPPIEDIENRHREEREENNPQSIQLTGEIGERKSAGFRALSEVRENLNKLWPDLPDSVIEEGPESEDADGEARQAQERYEALERQQRGILWKKSPF